MDIINNFINILTNLKSWFRPDINARAKLTQL